MSLTDISTRDGAGALALPGSNVETPTQRPNVVVPALPGRAGLTSRAKAALRRGVWHAMTLGQRLGVSAVPNHFYSPIPDVRDLASRTDWRAPMSMIGVAGWSLDSQLDFVRDCCPPPVVARLRTHDVHAEACAANGVDGYGRVEADFLYAHIVRHKPRSVVQIGAGVSTAVILRAAHDAGYRPHVVCIDPFPTCYLSDMAAEGRVELVREPAQRVPVEAFQRLGAGDLLFVDSTHAVKVGSEVNRIVLEVLPRLADGVWAHFHDIYFPYDYQRRVLDGEIYFSAESTLLHAFLLGNRRVELRAALSYLHYAARAELGAVMPNYRPAEDSDGLEKRPGHFPSSAWLRIVAER